MDLHLKEKVVIVTGASAGIGYATTQAFAQEGAIIVGVSRHTSSLNTLAQHYPVRDISVDLSTPDGPQQVVDAVVQQ